MRLSTIRCSRKRIVHEFDHHLVLGQVKVADKSNEIIAIPALLDMLIGGDEPTVIVDGSPMPISMVATLARTYKDRCQPICTGAWSITLIARPDAGVPAAQRGSPARLTGPWCSWPAGTIGTEFEQSSSMKNRKRESCTSGTVRDEDGNILIYSANDRRDRGNVGIIRSPNRSSILPDRTGHSTKIIHSAGC